MGENFFHEDIKRRMSAVYEAAAGALLKSSQISVRIAEAIHVVDSQTRHQPSLDKPQDHSVGGFENQGVFHADSHEIVDGKKAPVVDFIIGGEPVRKYVGLVGQQSVKQHKAGGVPPAAIEDAHVLIEESPHLGRVLIQLPESFLEAFPLHAPLPCHFGG